jgi:cytochrome c oxidase subunit 1
VPLIGSILFMVGAALIMVNILIFSYNLFSTVLSKSDPRSYNFFQFLRSAYGIPRLMKLLGKEDKNAPNLDYNGLPVFIVAVGRGSIDTVINAFVLLTAGALILVYGLFALFGSPLNPDSVDALLYKNWYWWGLDMVADGNALIYTAGVWYLLIPLLTGRRLFGENVVKTVILVDLLVSMGVWSHHLLGDTSQPMVMRILSGQLITWGEFFTMGLTIFASMMTVWLARPVKMTPALKFALGSMFGFAMGGIAGLMDKLPSQLQQAAAGADMGRAEREMRRMQGIIHSMTAGERARPELLKASRKRRIAAGAGVQVQDVNRLLSQFEQMQGMVRKMQKGGLAKMLRGM